MMYTYNVLNNQLNCQIDNLFKLVSALAKKRDKNISGQES